MIDLAKEDSMAGDIGVRVRFMGDLRAVIESGETKLSVPRGTPVGVLLRSLAEKYGDPFAKWLFTGAGDLHHSIVVFVNGENIRDIGGLSVELGRQGDQVEIIMLPMFEGG